MSLGAANLLEALTEHTDQVVFIYEVSTDKFAYLNPAFEKIWRKKRQSVMENPASLLKTVHPEDLPYVQQVYHDLLEGVILNEVEFRIKLRNQAEQWICVRPVLLEDQKVISGFAQEITTQKQYIEYLKKFSAKKNSILHILSHDLAGPLGLIGNMADLLKSDLKTNQNQEIHDVIQLIQKSSRQGLELIKEFLKQELLESAEVELVKRRVDLVKRLSETMIEYRQNQLVTGKTFHFNTSTDSLLLDLDDTKFMQAMNNLISNAIKFTPDGGEITVTLEEKEASVLLTVADNGIGIPGKHHAILFEKFTQARRPGIKGEPPVGLGMSIVKTMIELHQGHIWFQSQENQGTTFFIELPKTG